MGYSQGKAGIPREGSAGFCFDRWVQRNATIESPSLWMVPMISERISTPSAALRVNFTLN